MKGRDGQANGTLTAETWLGETLFIFHLFLCLSHPPTPMQSLSRAVIIHKFRDCVRPTSHFSINPLDQFFGAFIGPIWWFLHSDVRVTLVWNILERFNGVLQRNGSSKAGMCDHRGIQFHGRLSAGYQVNQVCSLTQFNKLEASDVGRLKL